MKYYFKNPANTAPLLVLAVFLLLYSSRLIDTALLTRENEYVAVIVLQLVIFLMPAAFYIRALGLDFTRFRISIFGPGHLLLLISGLIALTSGTILIDSYTLGDSAFAANYDLWGVFISKNEGTAQSSLYLILAYAALPALCEEFVFRKLRQGAFDCLSKLSRGLYRSGFACLAYHLRKSSAVVHLTVQSQDLLEFLRLVAVDDVSCSPFCLLIHPHVERCLVTE